MIYLIGGPPRVGKSTLAQKFTTELQIPWVSTDMVLWMVHEVHPELKLRDEYTMVPKKFLPYMDKLIKNTISTVPDYVIEGDAFHPEQVAELKKHYELKACFLGVSHITTEILRTHVGHNDWFDEISLEEFENLPKWLTGLSQSIKTECEKYSIPYFDTAINFHETIDVAFKNLIS